VHSCRRARQALVEDGPVWTLELPRGFLSFALEKDLRYDPAFLRHLPLIGEVLDRFKPDLLHITGPSEVGMLGARLAYEMELPLAASWHTNVHEYLARRSDWFVKLFPKQSLVTEQTIEDLTLAARSSFTRWRRCCSLPIRNCAICSNATPAARVA